MSAAAAPALDDLVKTAACSLQSGDWEGYKQQMRVVLSGSDEEAWGHLAACHPALVNLFSMIERLPKASSRDVCDLLLPAIGKLSTASVAEALALLRLAENAPPGYGYVPVQALKPHILARPELGRELCDALRSSGVTSEAVLAVWAGSFAEAAPGAAASHVLNLLAAPRTDGPVLVALVCALPIGHEEVRGALEPAERRVTDAIVASGGVDEGQVWSALTRVAWLSCSAREQLSKALVDGVPSATIAVANTLYWREPPAQTVTGVPLPELVQQLLEAGLRNDSIRGRIDSAVESLVFRESGRPLVAQCAVALGNLAENVVDCYGQLFAGLAHHQAEFERVLTAWLLEPGTNFGSLAELLSMCASHRAPIGLDEAMFIAQSRNRRVKAARRLLALTHNGPAICEFIAEIAEMAKLGDERLTLAAELLDLAFREYPRATEEFLKARVDAGPRHALHVAVYRAVYANVLRWRRVLGRLPRLKELRPGEAELLALRRLKRAVNREILRGASERSVFKDLFMNLHMAQGKKAATHTLHGPPVVTPYAESSHYIELPSSERADPMRGRLERNRLLRNAR